MKIPMFLLCCLCCCGLLYAAAGDLDSTFGGDGRVTTNFGSNADEATDIAVQPDGKIVAVGIVVSGGVDFGVARYNPDGSLDSGFGTGGMQHTDFGNTDLAEAVAIQADGKIVVAGAVYIGGIQDFGVVRYLPNGNLDTTFDSDGKVSLDFFGGTDYATDVAVQPDGKIVVAGYVFNAGDYDFALVRFNIDGSLDHSFDFDGRIIFNFGTVSLARAVALQPDGKIVVAGRESLPGDFALARFNPDGSPDTSFDSDGRVTTDFAAGHDEVNSVAVQPDGKIIVAGSAMLPGNTTDFALARYNFNGSLDTTFNFDGKLAVDFAGANAYAQSVVLQPDGKIVVTGFSDADPNDLLLLRVTSDGTVDSSFNGDGWVTTDFFGGNDEGFAAAVQPDGKILAAGWTENGPNHEFALARYETDSLPTCLFCDDFEDGVLASDWTYLKPSWSESGGNLIATSTRKAVAFASPAFAGCGSNCTFESSMMTAGGPGNKVWMLAWYADKNNTLEILMKEENGKFVVKQRAGGSVVAKAKGMISLLPNVAYNVKVTFDGVAFTLFVNGNPLATLTAAVAPSIGTVGFEAKNTVASFGHVLVE